MNREENYIIIDGKNLSLDDIVSVGMGKKKVEISKDCIEKCKKNREFLTKKVDEKNVIYGVNTSFGSMCNKIINKDSIEMLQENLIKSHAAGLGEPIHHTIALASLLVRLNSLVRGNSGVRVELLEFIKDLINNQIAPYIPTRGSVGASGDLIHLSHLALLIIGKGKAYYKGSLMEVEEIFKQLNIKPFKLSYKEGLALINGTSVMTAIAAFAVNISKKALAIECIAAAFTIEIFNSITDFLSEALHKVKPHEGQFKIAKILRELVNGSKNTIDRDSLHEVIWENANGKTEDKVFESSIFIQNVYSIRCTPQILSPVYEAIKTVEKIVTIEANSTNDNPIVIHEENHILHGGNFHGQSIGFYMDVLSIALSTLSNLAERRLNTLLDGKLNGELPEYLITGIKGLDLGFMGSQYLATSTTAENRQLANPVSTNTISCNSSNQDVVSMGTIAARKAYTSATNTKYILTLEILATLQAINIKGSDNLAPKTSYYYNILSNYYTNYESKTIFHEMLTNFLELIFEKDIINSEEILKLGEN